MVECKEVIHQLKRQQHRTWRIELNSLSPESLLTLLTDINECKVRRLYIKNTRFDCNCVRQLSEVITYNKTMKVLRLTSSPFLPDTYRLLATALTENKIIKGFTLYHDNSISDKDIPHLCHLITNNKTLLSLSFTNCRNITNFGKQKLQKVCVKNDNLKYFFINGNVLCYRY